MGEIERIERGRIALKADGANLRAVAKAMVEDVELEALTEGPKAPAKIELTPEFTQALRSIPVLFGQVQPEELRRLTEAEQVALYAEQKALKLIISDLSVREAAIKTVIRGHMALDARDQGLADEGTVLDASGFPIVARKAEPQRFNVPGTTEAWSLEYREGTPSIEGSRLLEMYDAGEIDRKTYLSMTREVRVFDENKAFEAMAKDPTLLSVFRRIVKKGRPSTGLFVRKQSARKSK
jgi:hypothetical protein